MSRVFLDTNIINNQRLRVIVRYKINSPFDAFTYIPEYVNSDFFADAIVSNLELNTVYGNTTNCIELVENSEIDLQWGGTLIKPLFLFLPRSIFEYKPNSIISVYTKKYAPFFYSKGGSYPVTVYAEMFANFYYFGIIFLFLFYFFLEKLYVSFINGWDNYLNKTNVALIFLFVTSIQYVRGSGLDLWLLYVIIGYPAALMIFFLRRIK